MKGMVFCEILRALIEEKNLTQKQVAGDLHIPASTIGGYIQGTSEPDFDTLKILARYFRVSADYLLDLQTEKTESHGEDELLRIFRALDDKQRAVYLEQGKAFLKITQKR